MKNLMSAVLLCTASLAYAGFDEGLAAYKKGNYAVALKEYKHAAKQGDASAQYNLGVMYGKGQGVPQDDAPQKWATTRKFHRVCVCCPLSPGCSRKA